LRVRKGNGGVEGIKNERKMCREEMVHCKKLVFS
jgi:hypothetical protein